MASIHGMTLCAPSPRIVLEDLYYMHAGNHLYKNALCVFVSDTGELERLFGTVYRAVW